MGWSRGHAPLDWNRVRWLWERRRDERGWGFHGKEREKEVDGREDKYFLGLMHLFRKASTPFLQALVNCRMPARVSPSDPVPPSSRLAVVQDAFRAEETALALPPRTHRLCTRRVPDSPRFLRYVSEARLSPSELIEFQCGQGKPRG